MHGFLSFFWGVRYWHRNYLVGCFDVSLGWWLGYYTRPHIPPVGWCQEWRQSDPSFGKWRPHLTMAQTQRFDYFLSHDWGTSGCRLTCWVDDLSIFFPYVSSGKSTTTGESIGYLYIYTPLKDIYIHLHINMYAIMCFHMCVYIQMRVPQATSKVGWSTLACWFSSTAGHQLWWPLFPVVFWEFSRGWNFCRKQFGGWSSVNWWLWWSSSSGSICGMCSAVRDSSLTVSAYHSMMKV